MPRPRAGAPRSRAPSASPHQDVERPSPSGPRPRPAPAPDAPACFARRRRRPLRCGQRTSCTLSRARRSRPSVTVTALATDGPNRTPSPGRAFRRFSSWSQPSSSWCLRSASPYLTHPAPPRRSMVTPPHLGSPHDSAFAFRQKTDPFPRRDRIPRYYALTRSIGVTTIYARRAAGHVGGADRFNKPAATAAKHRESPPPGPKPQRVRPEARRRPRDRPCRRAPFQPDTTRNCPHPPRRTSGLAAESRGCLPPRPALSCTPERPVQAFAPDDHPNQRLGRTPRRYPRERPISLLGQRLYKIGAQTPWSRPCH